jgi:hypothetical protein
MEFVDRDFSINLGGALIEYQTIAGEIRPVLRVVFKIEKNLSKEPNTAEVSIYNLRESTRGLLAQPEIPTVIEAGYVGSAHTIFRGKLDYGVTSRNGSDWISEFESTDGGKETRKQRINVSYKSIGIQGAMRAAADAMGLGLGNLEEKIAAGNIRGALSTFANGLVMSGQAAPQFDKLAKSFGFEWSIQDEQIMLLEPAGVFEPSKVIVLSRSTGLVGSPQAGEDGTVEARALMIPSLQPGRKVQIKSDLVDGFFRVERSVFLGDTWGQDWYTDIEAKPL